MKKGHECKCNRRVPYEQGCLLCRGAGEAAAPSTLIHSGRGDGGGGPGGLGPQLFAKMKFLEPLLFYFGISKVNT